jgi:hypothetical protein
VENGKIIELESVIEKEQLKFHIIGQGLHVEHDGLQEGEDDIHHEHLEEKQLTFLLKLRVVILLK